MRISDWCSAVCSSDLLRHTVNSISASGLPFFFDKAILTVLCCKQHDQTSSTLQRAGLLLGMAKTSPFTPMNFPENIRFSPMILAALLDRKSVVSGKGVSVRVDLGGSRSIKKKK